MGEVELAGAGIARALVCHKTADAVASALVGCLLYSEDPDDTAEIVAIDLPGKLLTLNGPSGQKRLSFRQLASGYVIEQRMQPRLEALVNAAKPPHVLQAEAARGALSKAGVQHGKLSDDDARQLADALGIAERQNPPPREAREQIAAILQRYELHRDYIRLASAWPGSAPSTAHPVMGDVVIQLVQSRRVIGDAVGALALTEVLIQPAAARPLWESERAILWTQRAAVFLDLYDRDDDPARLEAVRKCANRAWAIRPSDECSAVYQRLKKAEGELKDQRR